MKRLKLALLLFIAFILGAVTVLLIPPSLYEKVPEETVPKKLSPSIQSCMDEWEAKNLEIATGGILIQFEDNVSESEAKSIIDSYDLNLLESFYPSTKIALVKVPEGKEFEWICSLQEDSRIKYANPNSLNEPTDR